MWLAGTVIGEVVARNILTELAILWLASTVMGEIGAHSRGGMPPVFHFLLKFSTLGR